MELLNSLNLNRLRRAMRRRWLTLGRLNRMLVLAGTWLLLTLCVSMSFFVTRLQDDRNVKCLAMNIYHEARGEPTMGQYAVATVTMNRVKSAQYPEDLCQVVYQKAWSEQQQRFIAAFSWTTDDVEDVPHDSLAWEKALVVASEVYNENTPSKVRDALYYHADSVKPVWARDKLKITKIGHHVFYR